jgi:S-adenosylmethionine decarboxylase
MSASVSKVVDLKEKVARPDGYKADSLDSGAAVASVQKDFFVQKDGLLFAGSHYILDFWGARGLTDLEAIDATFRQAIEAAGATLLHIHLHHFGPEFGVSGVAVLAESHVSIHTWPERDYAAIDIFMCGDTDPAKAIAVLRDAFQPTRASISEHKRGIV